jgi:hypothetical protein
MKWVRGGDAGYRDFALCWYMAPTPRLEIGDVVTELLASEES